MLFGVAGLSVAVLVPVLLAAGVDLVSVCGMARRGLRLWELEMIAGAGRAGLEIAPRILKEMLLDGGVDFVSM